MTQSGFDLAEFRSLLLHLESDLSEEIKNDQDYQGEFDDLMGSVKRLKQELKDTKYQEVITDLFRVISFISIFDEDDEDDDLDDDDDFDLDEFDSLDEDDDD